MGANRTRLCCPRFSDLTRTSEPEQGGRWRSPGMYPGPSSQSATGMILFTGSPGNLSPQRPGLAGRVRAAFGPLITKRTPPSAGADDAVGLPLGFRFRERIRGAQGVAQLPLSEALRACVAARLSRDRNGDLGQHNAVLDIAAAVHAHKIEPWSTQTDVPGCSAAGTYLTRNAGRR